MSKAVTAEWQHLRSCSRLLASFLILLSTSSPTKAQRNSLDLAQSISASLKLRTALDLPLAEPNSDKLAVDRGSPVYLNLEDRLFFDKDKRDINSSVQELLAVFRELDDFLGPGDIWLHGHRRDQAALRVEDGWAGAGWANDTSEDTLLRSGMAAFLLAALASSGVASPLVHRDNAFAVHALRQAMEATDLGAQMALADRYFHGRGVAQNCTEGMRLARNAAEVLLEEAEAAGNAGMPPMEAPLLRHRLRDGSYPWKFWDRAAEAAELDDAAGGGEGILGALGLMGLGGLGGPRGPQEAPQNVQARAAGGDPFAMVELGNWLVNGDRVPQNYEQALVLYQAAAELGDPAGLMALGYMHMHGFGTPRNTSAAIDFYEGAALMGYPDACYNLGSLYGGLFEGVALEKINLTLSEEKYQCAYTGNHYKAPYMLALIHEAGLGVPRNCTKAARYMRVVLAERSDWSATIETAVKAHDEGDHWKALVMLAMAAEQGSPIAMHNAAFLLRRGRGYRGADANAMALDLLLRAGAIEHQYGDGLVDAAEVIFHGDRYGIPGGANHSRALVLYEEAAERGDIEGMTALAWMHATGCGTRVNASRALELYWNAVERAPDSAHRAAPLLAFCWLRARVVFGWGPGGGPGGGSDGGVRQDFTNICVLLGALWIVMWLRRSRSRNAAARRR